MSLTSKFSHIRILASLLVKFEWFIFFPKGVRINVSKFPINRRSLIFFSLKSLHLTLLWWWWNFVPANEANNIIVYIKDIDVSNVCGGIYQGPTFNSDVIYFMCPSESRGNSVHIQKTTRDQLGFCEIEVYE